MANPFYVAPLGGVDLTRQLEQMGTKIERREAEARAVQKFAETKKGFTEAYASDDPSKVAAFIAGNPEMAQAMNAAMKFRNDQEREQGLESYRLAILNPEAGRRELEAKAAEIESEGGDSSALRNAIDLSTNDPEAFKKMVELQYAGIATPQEWEAFQATKPGAIDEDLQVRATVTLEDGTMIQSTDKGPVVYNPYGEVVKGKAAADAIVVARAEEVENARKKAGGIRTAALEAELDLKAKVAAKVISAEEAARASVKAWEQTAGINKNIRMMDEAVRLIDSGAETGPIADMLPSAKEASVALDNLQAQLGLNVIQNTTFGSLSEAELKFALSSALPMKLEGPALKDWIKRKQDAQYKLLDYLEASAMYLGTPGNTVTGFMKEQRAKQTTRTDEARAAQEDTDFLTRAREQAGEPAARPPEITTQAEFDALPSGTYYFNPKTSAFGRKE